MWLYISYFQVFLLLTNIAAVFGKNVAKEHTIKEGTIFSDVIKNISRVNHALQELIRNYEKLQNLSKTQSFETDLSTDSEIDEFFKAVSKRSEKELQYEKKDEKTTKDFPGTPMLFSEEDEYITEKSNYLTDEDDKRRPAIESLQLDMSNASYSEDEQKVNKKVFKAKKGSHKNHKHSYEIKVPENVFFDNVQKAFTQKPTSKSDRGKKHKKHKVHKDRSRRDDEESSTAKDSISNVQKVIKSESFEQGIWKEIADNKKPIKLRKENQAPYELGRKPPDIQFQTYTEKPKTALVIVTKREHKLSKEKLSSEEQISGSMSEDDETMYKEIFKSSILREAYGEACTKVVVRKCFKACKNVLKSVCSSFKCKGKFKEKFKSSSKAGCIYQFSPNKGQEYQETKNYEITPLHGNGQRNKGDFKDITRGGFEACYPFLAPKLTVNNNTELRNSSQPSNTDSLQLNILRDSYERECERISASRCNKACKYAQENTCSIYSCKKNQNKLFVKLCKRQCKMSYRSKKSPKTKDSSRSSESESSSASDSDGSADGDDSEK